MPSRRSFAELGEERLYFPGVIRLVALTGNGHPGAFDVQRVPDGAQFGHHLGGFVRQGREIPRGAVGKEVLRKHGMPRNTVGAATRRLLTR